MIPNPLALNALRQTQAGLSDADFLTWGQTRAVDPAAPQVTDRITFKSYLLDQGLWPRLQAAASGANGATAAGYAASCITYINDPDYPTVDFKSARGATLMGGLIANGVFTAGELGAALVSIFGRTPFDAIGGIPTQDDLDALPRIAAITALRESSDAQWDTANILHNARGQKLNTLYENAAAVPADLAGLDAMGAS